jgi:hypothetical protein
VVHTEKPVARRKASFFCSGNPKDYLEASERVWRHPRIRARIHEIGLAG